MRQMIFCTQAMRRHLDATKTEEFNANQWIDGSSKLYCPSHWALSR